MATKNFSDWRTEVNKYAVTSINETSVLDDAVKECIREFCEDTASLRQTATFSVVASDRDYDLDAELDSTNGKVVIVGVDSALYKANGQDNDQYRFLYPLNEPDVDDSRGAGLYIPHENGFYSNAADSWEFHEAEEPTHFWLDFDDTFNLYPIPTEASTNGLRVKIVTKPADDATKVPAWFFKRFKTVIAKGAAARLMNMPGKKWYDAPMADRYNFQYESMVEQFKTERWSGRGRKKMSVRFPFWSGSRNQTIGTY